MSIAGLTQEQFRDVLKRHFTPARPISSPEYLRGREAKLTAIDRAFNSEGKHIFIFGDRGVGKTSLARTAASLNSSADGSPATVDCEQDTKAYQLLRDIAIRCLPPRHLLQQPKVKETLRAGLPFFGAEVVSEVQAGQVPEIKSLNEGIAVVHALARANQREPVVIVDEFDVIQDIETRRTFASFLKHTSDQEIPLRFIVCGIGDSLDEMIGHHLSTGRYLLPVALERLPHDARWEIINSAAKAAGILIDEETCIRIGQVSDGFPYFIHLIGEKLFWAAQDDPSVIRNLTPAHFEKALLDASAEAEPNLKRGYEKATQKYTNDYEHVLWALADDARLRRQVKEIYASYLRVVQQDNGRDKSQNILDQQKFYQRVNALKKESHGSIIRTTGAGWFEFRENRQRGYIRLVAERRGVKLEPEHYLAGRRFPREWLGEDTQ